MWRRKRNPELESLKFWKKQQIWKHLEKMETQANSEAFHSRAQPGRLRVLKPLLLYMAWSKKVKKKYKQFYFLQILCVELHQNITATLSYPPSHLILSNLSS